MTNHDSWAGGDSSERTISISSIAAWVYILWGVTFLTLVFCLFLVGICYPNVICCPWLTRKKKTKGSSLMAAGLMYSSYLDIANRNGVASKIGTGCEDSVEPPPPTWGIV